ncbi:MULTISPECIES: family 43 glycosylhydrolase [Clostridium]|uniref:beta-xylosidase family glycoside hydrolase n=1 Tax=Clostridium TaxID=1485 RepID=UPI0009BD66A1|nr:MULTISPECIES: family 43 glycosylhydrolase [Clostridium]PJI10448.1 glycoside hydrolase family 43 protein [Clostridium sp. CT7]
MKNSLCKKKFSFKKLSSIAAITCILITAVSFTSAKAYTSDLGNGTYQNPVMYADYPDNCVIKVGTTYYMACSSINYMPGLPILKSEDLVNWETCSYAFDRIDAGMNGIDKAHADAYNLVNGKNVYANGCWAPSLKYHDGTFYATFSSLDLGKTFVCTKKAPMGFGGWDFTEIKGLGYSHDADLFFDTDGRVYLINGGCNVTELTSDCKSVKPGGINKKVFDGGSSHDGNRIFKRNGYYYILSTPVKENGPYQRIEKAWRSRSLTGPYEQKVILDDGANHQVCVVEDGSYNWAMLFEDKGAVGRIPKLAPVTWTNDWPMIGINGKIPLTYTKPAAGNGIKSPGTTDEFEAQGSISSQWQWNHNPDNSKWSTSERPGWLRLKTSYSADLLQARNTLTQRIQGPASSGYVKLDASNLKPGQISGLSAFHCKYGYIAVKNDNGTKKLVQYNVDGKEYSINLTNNTIYLKVDADCNAETAKFYYSYNGSNWTQFGSTLKMNFFYKLWFVGYRFALFNYTTGHDTSGYADFDYFRFSPTATGTSTGTNPSSGVLNNGWYRIKNVHAEKYLQVAGNIGRATQNVELDSSSSAAGQKWYLNNIGNGLLTLKSALGDFTLDVCGGANDDGTKVEIYNAYGHTPQQFSLKPSSSGNSYVITTMCSNGSKALDDCNYSTNDGANVCEWSCTGGDNQSWSFEPAN